MGKCGDDHIFVWQDIDAILVRVAYPGIRVEPVRDADAVFDTSRIHRFNVHTKPFPYRKEIQVCIVLIAVAGLILSLRSRRG